MVPPYTLEYVEGQAAPSGYVDMHVPGTVRVWVEKDLAARIIALLDRNKLHEARTMILWFGGEKEPS
jgi:hypothetical protein